MIEMPSGASGMSTVEGTTKCDPESFHSIVARVSPGHGGPFGGLTLPLALYKPQVLSEPVCGVAGIISTRAAHALLPVELAGV